jgi:hypothetical protein
MNVSPATQSPTDATARDAAANVLGALVFREVLKPLSAALGPMGDAIADRFADTLIARPKP